MADPFCRPIVRSEKEKQWEAQILYQSLDTVQPLDVLWRSASSSEERTLEDSPTWYLSKYETRQRLCTFI